MKHDKITFTREYCLARRIPYKIKREALFIDGVQFCYSLYNLTYADIVNCIDSFVKYDDLTTFYIGIDDFFGGRK